MKIRYINASSFLKYTMTYLKEKGYEARAFYLNILYLVLLVLGALAATKLNAHVHLTRNGTEVTAPLYRSCYIDGTQAQYTDSPTTGCIEIAGTEDADGNFVPTGDTATEQLATMDALNGIAIAVIVFNVIVGLHSVIMHFGKDPWDRARDFGISYHFEYQWAISLINVGLFTGIVAHLVAIEDIQSEVNVKNNLYYTDVNLFLVGVAGVVITTLDLVASNMIVYCLCTPQKGYMCNPKK